MPTIILKAQNSTLCFFVNDNEDRSGVSDPVDFCKRVDTFLGPLLSKSSRDIKEFCAKAKPTGWAFVLNHTTSLYLYMFMVVSNALSVMLYSNDLVCVLLYNRLEQQYRYIYFNQVNLAVKSSLFSKRSPHNTITSDIMKLIGEISAEYQR